MSDPSLYSFVETAFAYVFFFTPIALFYGLGMRLVLKALWREFK